jgi:hypothetical protein
MSNIPAASMRWCGVLGSLTGWLVGYFFNSWVSRTRMHRPGWRPEFRLHGVWIPAFCMVCGLLTYGLSINYHRHWIGLAFGWWGVNIGLVGMSVAITAFALEKYAEDAAAVSAILNMWRTSGMYTSYNLESQREARALTLEYIGGFSVSYFQSAWIARAGVGVVFGCQAAIVAVGVIVLISSTMAIGKTKT